MSRNGIVTDLERLLADPYLAETGFSEPVRHPSEGKILTMAVPVMFRGRPAKASASRRPASANTPMRCAAVGYSDAEIDRINV